MFLERNDNETWGMLGFPQRSRKDPASAAVNGFMCIPLSINFGRRSCICVQYIYIYIGTYIIYIYIYEYIYIYIHTYICMYVYVCIRVCVYIYIYIWIIVIVVVIVIHIIMMIIITIMIGIIMIIITIRILIITYIYIYIYIYTWYTHTYHAHNSANVIWHTLHIHITSRRVTSCHVRSHLRGHGDALIKVILTYQWGLGQQTVVMVSMVYMTCKPLRPPSRKHLLRHLGLGGHCERGPAPGWVRPVSLPRLARVIL